ncbi:MAG: metal-dependent transcriptional regulator [Planctomycetota bacterium]
MKKRKEEILELAWVGKEKGSFTREDVEKSADDRISPGLLDELIKEGYLKESGRQVSLTPEGEKDARRLIRAHRLSERLFTDVLDIKPQNMEKHACTFEHFLNDEVVDSICTLLGHPRECPHGRPIPAGACCKKALKEVSPIVVPLSELKIGSEARIAYVVTKQHQRLDQLTAFGIVPGATLHLHQITPSYVVRVGETDIALDTDIVRTIYVRCRKTEA